MGPKIPDHQPDVAAAMGAGDSFLLIRLKFGKCFTRPMRLKACICNCVKSLKIGGISPMMQPLKNCAFSLCETSNKIGKCLPVHGDMPPLSLQFYSVNVLLTPCSHLAVLSSPTKFRILPVPTLD